jgi:hypothetical protein
LSASGVSNITGFVMEGIAGRPAADNINADVSVHRNTQTVQDMGEQRIRLIMLAS